MVCRNEIRGILLYEVPGTGDGYQREVLLDQVPGAAECTRQQCLIAKAMKLETGTVTLGSGRRWARPGLGRG